MGRVVDAGKTVYRGTKSLWKKYHFLVPLSVIKKDTKYLFRILFGLRGRWLDPLDKTQYNLWVKTHKKQTHYAELKYKPLISVLIPVYNVEPRYLTECIESVLAQSYDKFEICIVDDASTNPETIEVLKKYEDNKKIHIIYRQKNGHISRASNDALKMARGEFVALLDNDDMLARDALYEVVLALQDKKIDMVYTDEDKLDIDGARRDPNFKSDFAPDSLLSSNYISHLGVLRKSIVEKIGGFRVGFEGAQDYDLYLRFTEQTQNICHIPEVLYHWRMIPGSTAAENDNKNYALECGKKALEEALKRRKIKGEVKIAKDCPYYYIEYKIIGSPKVEIIIPTKDMAEMTEQCLESIYQKTTYNNFEITVVNNNSQKPETIKLFEKYKNKFDNFRVVDAKFDFNYAKINNLAVKQTKSDYIVLMNNDTEVITPNWLDVMLGYAEQKHVGAVGAKLVYLDDTVQHAGVILGLGVASHAFVGEEKDAIVWGGRLSVPYNYSAVTGACLMVSRKKWEEVGGLEEKLKVAYNDIDFCLKLLEAGYYNVLAPQVVLKHYESKSRGLDNTSEKRARFDAEQDYMYKKWKKRIENDEFYNPNYSRLMWYKLDKEGK